MQGIAHRQRGHADSLDKNKVDGDAPVLVKEARDVDCMLEYDAHGSRIHGGAFACLECRAGCDWHDSAGCDSVNVNAD